MLKHFVVLGIASVCLFAALQTASAQGRFGMSTEERVKMLKDSLSLNAAQVKKITSILTDADKERQDIFGQSGGDRDAMREKMMALRDSTDKKIEAELTKKQKQKYEEIKKQRQQRMRSFQGQ